MSKAIKIISCVLITCISVAHGMENNPEEQKKYIPNISQIEKTYDLNDNPLIYTGNNHLFYTDIGAHILSYYHPKNDYLDNLILLFHDVSKAYEDDIKIQQDLLLKKALETEIQIQQLLLKDALKTLMRLSMTCKDLHRTLLLKKIFDICSYYNSIVKDRVLQDIVKPMHPLNYQIRLLPTLILIYAGANPTVKTMYCEDNLLENAIFLNDEQMIEMLLEHHVNPNARSNYGPLFYYAKTVKVVDMFIKYGCNIHAENNKFHPNVLWMVIDQKYSSEILKFYLKRGVDAKKTLDPSDREIKGNKCLLHKLAEPTSLHINDIDDFLQKGELLLKAIPAMINHVDNDGNTPTDIALKSLRAADTYMGSGTPQAFERLIMLYTRHGGSLS